jgi:GAF domain-containing protein
MRPPEPPPDALRRLQQQFAIATADGSADARLGTLSELLRKVREQLKMDVVFVSELVGGQRVFRYAETAPGVPQFVHEGASDPREESYCQRVVDGRLPEVIRDARALPEAARLPATAAIDVRGHLSVPIVLRDGRVYGTVCCFSHVALPWLEERDARTLRSVAELIARRVEARGGPR